MAEKDFAKLQSFVEAAISNPKHPVYKLGLQHSAILQHYAVNVATLESIKPAQWFVDYPDKTAKLEEVMRLCEEEETATTQAQTDFEKLLQRVIDLEAKLTANATKPVEEKPPEETQAADTSASEA